ncbi:MAG: serine/threonine protein kinase [Deltaproteobacteria bacterium]|nr:serine/threonine protein kinase [Deltaproteobacteria bacterium]
MHHRLFGGEKRQAPDHYELHEEIGRGRFGRVHRATDTRLQRTLALKLIEYQTEAERARLERESHALAQLSHPNVVQVFEKGLVDSGRFFLAMELVEGHRLVEWLGEVRRPLDTILEVFAQAAEGLHHAHERGLVHRDFKPSNVMVDTTGRARILDFGLVKFADATPSTSRTSATSRPSDTVDSSALRGETLATVDGMASDHGAEQPDTLGGGQSKTDEPVGHGQLTQAGVFMGTPHYAAPEQFAGLPTDARSDQFSLCASLYEAIHGVRPFAGRTMREISTHMALGQLAPGDGKRRVPRWLKHLLARGLSRRPEDRHESVGHIGTILRKHLTPSYGARARYAAIGAVSAAGLVGALMLGQSQNTDPALSWDGAWPQASSAAGIERIHGRALRERLESYGGRWQAASAAVEGRAESSSVRECLQAGKDQFHSFVQGLEASQQQLPPPMLTVSRERIWLEYLYRPEDCLKETPSWETDQMLATQLLGAQSARLHGHYPEAKALLDQARQAFPRDLTLRSGMLDYQLGTVELLLGDASAWATLEHAERANEGDQRFVTDVLARRIEAGLMFGVASTEQIESLVTALEQQGTTDNNGAALLAQAFVSFKARRYAEARDRYSQARASFSAGEGTERRAPLIAYCDLHEVVAQVWSDSTSIDVDRLLAAVSTMRESLGKRHPATLRHSMLAARALEKLGRLEAARDLLGTTLADRGTAPPSSDRERFDVLRARVEHLHLDVQLKIQTKTWTDGDIASWKTRAHALDEAVHSGTRPDSFPSEYRRVRELLVEAYGRTSQLDAAVALLASMAVDARKQGDVRRLCYYAAPFQAHTSAMTHSSQDVMDRLKQDCPDNGP